MAGPPAVLPHRYAMMPVVALSPHPANPTLGDTNAIADSIEALGFYGVVLVHEATGHILAGEHRWRAATLKGLPEVPAIVVDCDDRTAEKILTGDNAYARLARWDTGKLADLLTSFGHDLAGSGFTTTDLALAELSLAEDATTASRNYDPQTIGPVLVIHAPIEVIQAFRQLPGEDDLARLTGLLEIAAAA